MDDFRFNSHQEPNAKRGYFWDKRNEPQGHDIYGKKGKDACVNGAQLGIEQRLHDKNVDPEGWRKQADGEIDGQDHTKVDWVDSDGGCEWDQQWC